MKSLGNPDSMVDISIRRKIYGLKDEIIKYHVKLEHVILNEIPDMVSIVYKEHKKIYRQSDIVNMSIKD